MPNREPPSFVTDAAELDRLAARAARSTARFRRWVKTRCEMGDDALDAAVRGIADEVWKGIDCGDCAKCCHAQVVTVDKADVRRLARALRLDEAAFRRRYVRADGESEAVKAGPCPFLVDTRCTVYEARPTACRDFPFLHSKGFSDRILYLSDLAHLCPIVYATLEEVKRRLSWREGR